jgi:hypothetical protein
MHRAADLWCGWVVAHILEHKVSPANQHSSLIGMQSCARYTVRASLTHPELPLLVVSLA